MTADPRALWARLSALPNWLRAALAVLALICCFLLWDHFDDKAAIDQHDAAANLAAEKGAREADAAAAEQRLKDAAANREQDNAYHDAIDAAPTGAPAAAAVALGCERLRRQGQDTAAIPACSGR